MRENKGRRALILRGIPGSGKSTFALTLAEKGWTRINKDDIRDSLKGAKMVVDESKVHAIQATLIEKAVKRGDNIVIDNTHARDKYVRDAIKTIENVVSPYSYDIDIKLFDVPLEVCIERNAARVKPVPVSVIRQMHKTLSQTKI